MPYPLNGMHPNPQGLLALKRTYSLQDGDVTVPTMTQWWICNAYERNHKHKCPNFTDRGNRLETLFHWRGDICSVQYEWYLSDIEVRPTQSLTGRRIHEVSLPGWANIPDSSFPFLHSSPYSSSDSKNQRQHNSTPKENRTQSCAASTTNGTEFCWRNASFPTLEAYRVPLMGGTDMIEDRTTVKGQSEGQRRCKIHEAKQRYKGTQHISSTDVRYRCSLSNERGNSELRSVGSNLNVSKTHLSIHLPGNWLQENGSLSQKTHGTGKH